MSEWKRTFLEFDAFLDREGMSFEAVLIGGSALTILNIIDRPTRDADILVPKIPEAVRDAAARFASSHPALSLDPTWLNNGPEDIQTALPVGWHGRLVPLHSGKALKLETLAREDFLKAKLYAYCNPGAPDFQDLLKMKPSVDELEAALPWIQKCKDLPQWAEHCKIMFGDLARSLAQSGAAIRKPGTRQ